MCTLKLNYIEVKTLAHQKIWQRVWATNLEIFFFVTYITEELLSTIYVEFLPTI